MELTRELKVSDDEADESMSLHSLHGHGAGMAITTTHEKNHDSVNSADQLADWAHRA